MKVAVIGFMLLVGGATLMASGSTATPPAYESARAALVLDGRAVARLVRDGDVEAVFARFSPELARAVPKTTVEQVLRETLGTAPIGARTGESALPASPTQRMYFSDHVWGSRTLALRVVLDAESAIVGIDVRPSTALPRDPNAGQQPKSRLSLPFRGEWWVFWGGPSERQNYHVIARDQRHAYDFLGWRFGGTHRGSGARNTDYWAWGRPVVAPADGVVVAALDGVRDNRPRIELENRRNPAGNHVVLDLGNGEYALLAHLQRGSLRVRAGQRVRAGELLGLCGNSGNSSEPHLHFHVQDRAPLFGKARGLPLVFRGYVADGRRIGQGTPVQGQFLRP